MNQKTIRDHVDSLLMSGHLKFKKNKRGEISLEPKRILRLAKKNWLSLNKKDKTYIREQHKIKAVGFERKRLIERVK